MSSFEVKYKATSVAFARFAKQYISTRTAVLRFACFKEKYVNASVNMRGFKEDSVARSVTRSVAERRRRRRRKRRTKRQSLHIRVISVIF